MHKSGCDFDSDIQPLSCHATGRECGGSAWEAEGRSERGGTLKYFPHESSVQGSVPVQKTEVVTVQQYSR